MPAQRLTDEQITTAALALVDSVGPGALTMRALAERLGVGTMTLYGYYRSRDELLDAVVDAATAGVADPQSTRWTDPRNGLTTLFGALHEVLTQHPGLHRMRRSRPFLSPGVLRLTDRAIGLLTEAGLDGDDAVRAYRTLYLYTLGCATYARQESVDTRRSLNSLPDGDFHHLRRVAPAMIASAGSGREFEYGLGALLAALTPMRG
ncbi:MAG: TetR family transcriptional regulator [Actinocatenispora sp.]